MPAGKGNEAGHWESHAISQLNERLLSSAGSSWDDCLAFNPGWLTSPKAAQFHNEALEVLDKEFGASSLFVLKDPRICRLAPFWLNVLAAHGTVARAILPLRNPLEVAASLAARDGLAPAIGHVLWLRHALEAEHATRGRERYFTSYDGILKNWAAVAADAAEALQLSWPRQSARVDADVVAFLDKKRRHHEEAISDTLGNPHLASWLRDSFRVFADWAKGGEKQQDFALLDRIRTEFDVAAPAFAGILVSSRAATQKNAKLQAEHKSLTEVVQAGERTIAELRTKLEESEKGAAAQVEKLRKLEGAVDSTRQELVAQKGLAVATAAERDGLREALRIAEAGQQAALAKLQTDHKSLTEVAQAGERTIVGLRTKLDETEKRAAAQTERLRALEGAVDSTRQELIAQKDLVVTTSAERDTLKDAVRAAERTIAGLRTTLDEADQHASAQTAKVQQLHGELNLARTLEREHAQTIAAAQQSTEELSKKLAESENWIFRLSAERVAHERRLAEHAAKLAQLTDRGELLAGQNAAMHLRLEDSERELASVRLLLAEKELVLEETNTARKAVEWRLSERFDEIAALTQRLRDKDAEIAGARGDAGTIVTLRKQLAEKDASLAAARGVSEAVVTLRKQLAEKDVSLAQAMSARKEADAQLAKRFDEIAALTQALREREKALREKASEITTARERVARLDAELKATTAQRETELKAATQRAQKEKKEAESQLAERFGEIARLTRIVNDAEAAARHAQAQRDWLRETASILASGSRSVKGALHACLPSALRLARQMDHLKQRGLFDAQAYFAGNPDVAQSTQDPLGHYLRHGLLEGRPLSVSIKDEAK
jgi:hypothetical protein